MVALVDKVRQPVTAELTAARRRWTWFDHVARTVQRLGEVNGGRMAAAVTYAGFLALFPLFALAFAVFGVLLGRYPSLLDSAERALSNDFPGLVGGRHGLDLNSIAHHAGTVGVFGLVGLVLTGLNWVNALRSAERAVHRRREEPNNFFIRKLLDLGVLAGLGVIAAVSVAITTLSAGMSDRVAGWLGSSHPVIGWLVATSGLVVSLLLDVLLFGYLLVGLPRLGMPWRDTLGAAVLGAVGFELLKQVGTWYVGRTTHNALYGTFAIAIGLLLWVNLVTRLLMICSAWLATACDVLERAPGQSVPDTCPSPSSGSRDGAEPAAAGR
ncbi:MAG: YihY/virulence factor BrkB family protein [Mycobacteriales bacterium]